MHKVVFEVLNGNILAHSKVVLVYDLNCDMNCLTGLLELDPHFVDSIDNAFTPLQQEFNQGDSALLMQFKSLLG